MEESISQAAGSEHGDHLDETDIRRLIEEIGRVPYERTTTYGRRCPAARTEHVESAATAAIVRPTPTQSATRISGLPSGY